jgi:hypothetical protein
MQNTGVMFVEQQQSPMTFSTEMEELELKLYPNPATDRLNILAHGAEDMKVFIFNATGQQVYYGEELDNHEVIDISNFEKGFYIVKVITDGEVITSKLLKQ